MSDQTSTDQNWKSFADFLSHAPPTSSYCGYDVASQSGRNNYSGRSILIYKKPEIVMQCDGECQGERYFDSINHESNDDLIHHYFLTYSCRHCKDDYRVFALSAEVMDNSENQPEIKITKIGQEPPFGPHTPARMLRMIQDDREMFLQGRRAESLNLGIGAYAYYRRVVENQWQKLLDKFIEIAELNSTPDVVAQLKASKGQWRFDQSVKDVKVAIPEALKVAGQNPLTALHNATSKAIHELSDAECLSRAHDVRVLLTELAQRIADITKNDAELKSAIGRLIQHGRDDQQTK